jgi:hypothetical protein
MIASETQLREAKATLPMPNRFFHYRGFKEAHLVSLLSEGMVKLSRPDGFNDPWDCRVHVQVPTDTQGRIRLLDWLTESHRKLYPSRSESERVQITQWYRDNPEKLEEDILQGEPEMYRDICNKYRVYCLSEIPDSPLMWAHYAASHTGICLEYDAQTLPFTGAIKVIYGKSYPAHDLVTSGYEPLVTKSADWSYEVEWRLVALERGFALSSLDPDLLITDNDFLTLPRGVLRSVTIGCLADAASRVLIERLVKTHAPDVLVRQAALAPDRYELRITPTF